MPVWVTVEVENFKEVEGRLLAFDRIFAEVAGKELIGPGFKAVNYVRDEAPKWRGELKRSVSARTEGTEISVTIGAPYAPYVHFGTRPHWVGVDKIRAWAEDHGINPYALQWSIAQKGTRANPFIDRAFERLKKDLEPAADELAEALVEESLGD